MTAELEEARARVEALERRLEDTRARVRARSAATNAAGEQKRLLRHRRSAAALAIVAVGLAAAAGARAWAARSDLDEEREAYEETGRARGFVHVESESLGTRTFAPKHCEPGDLSFYDGYAVGDDWQPSFEGEPSLFLNVIEDAADGTVLRLVSVDDGQDPATVETSDCRVLDNELTRTSRVYNDVRALHATTVFDCDLPDGQLVGRLHVQSCGWGVYPNAEYYRRTARVW